MSPGAIANTLATVAANGKPQSAFLKEARPCADGVFGKHRVSHLLCWLCLAIPGVLGFFYPGLTHFDDLVGIPALPRRAAAIVIGALLLVPGVYLLIASNAALNRVGHGAAAFKLTKVVVQSAVYEKTRNPMSLGYYLSAAGIALLAGSTYLTCIVFFLLIPAHALNLKFFEELELELRYGQPYREYKQRVPFLIPSLR